jgi:hypothetical protein
MKLKNHNQKKKYTKYLWDQCDKEDFSQCVENKLSGNPINTQPDIEDAIANLMDALTSAMDETVPTKTIHKNTKPNPVPEEILQQINQCKQATKAWKDCGKPSLPHPLALARKEEKRLLRSLSRRAQASNREKAYQRIMQASSDDTKLMHKLIAKQRSSSNQEFIQELLVDDVRYTDDDQILELWRQWFADLATPTDENIYDPYYKTAVDKDRDLIRELCKSVSHTHIPFTSSEIIYYINKLNKKKAADEKGIRAEHFLAADTAISSRIATIFDNIIQQNYIPQDFYSGILLPLHKKGKIQNQRDNYRGITISAILGKIFEHVMLAHYEHKVLDAQNSLQSGFTKGASPLHAAVMLTEAICESKGNGQVLYTATLDARKAFDVVHHSSLLRKLYLGGMSDSWWLLKDQLYSGLTTKVKWKENMSKPFQILQGVRQGGIPSATDYKAYINDVLDILEKAELGLYIGDIFCGVPACADDLILLASTALILSCMLYVTMLLERDILSTQQSQKLQFLIVV